MDTKKLIAQIHIARKDLGMDEDTYRAMLKRVTGKTSCAGMGGVELSRVVAEFKAKGWKPTRNQGKASRISPASRGRQADLLRAVWIDMAENGMLRDGSETALNRWVFRQSAPHNHGQGIANVDWLPPELAQKLIEELKQWRRRLGRQQSQVAQLHAD